MIAKITMLVVASAMSINRHVFLLLTLKQKWHSGPFMSLQCADLLLLTAPFSSVLIRFPGFPRNGVTSL